MILILKTKIKKEKKIVQIIEKKEEIESTFKYEENPPWIFAETWNEAVEKCMSTEINSQSVIEWWNRRISKIKTKVKQVL